jgi:integrase
MVYRDQQQSRERNSTTWHDVDQAKGLYTDGKTAVGSPVFHSATESASATIRPRSRIRYEELVRLHLIPTLGNLTLNELTPQVILKLYAQKLEVGLSPTTVNLPHNVLHRALESAVRWELIGRNACDAVSPPKKGRHEIHPFGMEQAQHLLAAANGHPLEALYVLALTTGMRRGELLALKWQDIDLEAGRLQVRRTLTRLPGKRLIEAEPKTEHSRRTIVLAPLAIEALKQHRLRQHEARLQAGPTWNNLDYVFCSKEGTPLSPSPIIRRFKQLLREASLPEIRFHDLRHSTASLLLFLGVHPKIVQELLGHNQIGITLNIYSHVLPNLQQEAIAKLQQSLASH